MCVGICITYTVVAGDDLNAVVAEYVPKGNVPPSWVFYLAFAGERPCPLGLVLGRRVPHSKTGSLRCWLATRRGLV